MKLSLLMGIIKSKTNIHNYRFFGGGVVKLMTAPDHAHACRLTSFHRRCPQILAGACLVADGEALDTLTDKEPPLSADNRRRG